MAPSHEFETSERPHKKAAKNDARPSWALSDFLAEHLADMSRVFGGDLQQALILAVLGRTHLVASVSGRWRDIDPSPAMTASQLAEATAIPRQTVRRKLLAMKALGWLEQDDKQAWRLAMRGGRSAASVALRGLDARGIHRAMRLAGVLQGSS
jgi:IclR helix-turn-helix domain